MRSKLIRFRGPTITPIMFLIFIVACCMMLALSARVADKWKEPKERNLDLCPLCGQSVRQ
jgi:hypothetical protein